MTHISLSYTLLKTSKVEIICNCSREAKSLRLAVCIVLIISFGHHTRPEIISVFIWFKLLPTTLGLHEILLLLAIACIHLIEAVVVAVVIRRRKWQLLPKCRGCAFTVSLRARGIVVSRFSSIFVSILIKPFVDSLNVSEKSTGIFQQIECLT